MPLLHKVDCECNDCNWKRNAEQEESELERSLDERLARINELDSELRSLKYDVSYIRRSLASYRNKRKAEAKKAADPLRGEKEAAKEQLLVARRERWERVLAMRESGMSFPLIGEALGVSSTMAKSIHSRAEMIKAFEARFGVAFVKQP
jgi:septal ring factor EnvC (AmiA/AmiB activator)